MLANPWMMSDALARRVCLAFVKTNRPVPLDLQTRLLGAGLALPTNPNEPMRFTHE